MKTKEELNALKQEIEALRRKLAELNEEELSQVSGGATIDGYPIACLLCDADGDDLCKTCSYRRG